MSAAPFTFDDDDFATAFPAPTGSRPSEPPPPPSDADPDLDPDDPFTSIDRSVSYSSSNSNKRRPDDIATTSASPVSKGFSTQSAMSPYTGDDDIGEEKSLASLTNAADFQSTTKSFATSMTHNFEVVSKQVELGIYATKRVASFIKKITAMEEEFAKNLQKQLAHEQTKMLRLKGDGMKQYFKSWEMIQDAVVKHTKYITQFTGKVMSEVVIPLSKCKEENEDTRKSILAEQKKCTAEMARARDDVMKGQLNCQNLINSAKQTLEREKSTSAPQKASASGLFQKFQQKLTKSSKAIQQDAAKAAIAYNQAILAANTRQANYLGMDLPRVHSRMQQLEKTRLDNIKAKLTKYVQLRQAHTQEEKDVVDDLRRAVDSLNSDTDISGFIEDWVYQNGPPNPSMPYIYQLPCTPKEIEAGMLEGNPNSVFRSTLQHVMELQKDSDPKLDVPKIVVTLIKAVKDLKGYESEGIFRISVAKSELEALHKQIDGGDYNIRVNTPHAPAALLKEWLRLLAEPLIPEDLYEDAIASVKDREYSPAVLIRLFDRLPKINQKVVEHLAAMAKDVSSPKYSEVNKMSIDNLAIVFAPSFLRNPSDDPLKLLENSKYETKFTASLFKALP